MDAARFGKILPDLSGLLQTLPNSEDPLSYQTEDAMLADIFFFNAMGSTRPMANSTSMRRATSPLRGIRLRASRSRSAKPRRCCKA
jgi:hypothetical protein